MVGVPGQIRLVVGDNGQISPPSGQHTTNREQRGAEHVNHIGLEVVQVIPNGEGRQGNARLRGGGDAQRGQGNHLRSTNMRGGGIRSKNQYLAPSLLEITQGQISGFRDAIDLW